MGCDIHGIWQAKKDGQWVDVESNYDQERNYYLFGVLAGVRGDYRKPIAECRGLPDDFVIVGDCEHPIDRPEIRDPRRREYYRPDDEEHLMVSMGDHSYSWATADEIAEHDAEPDETRGGWAHDEWEALRAEARRLRDLHGEVRFVFGFDS